MGFLGLGCNRKKEGMRGVIGVRGVKGMEEEEGGGEIVKKGYG